MLESKQGMNKQAQMSLWYFFFILECKYVYGYIYNPFCNKKKCFCTIAKDYHVYTNMVMASIF
jgi:hypothetical protein